MVCCIHRGRVLLCTTEAISCAVSFFASGSVTLCKILENILQARVLSARGNAPPK